MLINYPRRVLALVLAGFATFSIALHAAEVRVETEYGKEKVTPRAGIINVTEGEQTFDAPEFVYLNRNFEELDAIGNVNDSVESRVAYYRARNVGYAIDGELVQGAERFFKKTVTAAGLTVVWKWELDYAVFVESTPTTDGAVLPGDGIGNPDPAVGRIWAPKDTQLTAAIDRSVGNDTLGFRYSAEAYELKNVRRAPEGSPRDSYVKFAEDLRQGRGFIVDLEAQDGFSISWWGKIDRKLDSGRDAVFFSLAPRAADQVFSNSFPERNNEKRPLNSMTVGVRPDGQLFVEEVVPSLAVPGGILRELAALPSALVGLEWHHWTLVFDFPEEKVTLTSATETISVTVPFTGADELRVTNLTQNQVLDLGDDYEVDPDSREITLINPAATSIADELLISSRRDIQVYRDGALVFNKGLPIPVARFGTEALPNDPSYKPAILQGVQESISYASATYRLAGDSEGVRRGEKFEGALNNIAFWESALPLNSRMIIEHAESTGGRFDIRPRPPGFFPRSFVEQFEPGLTWGTFAVLPFPPEARTVLRIDKGPVPLGDTGDRLVTEPVTVDDWLRVRWRWDAQVRYRFDAAGGQPGETGDAFDGQALVRYYDLDETAVEATVYNSGTNTDVWVPVGRKVEVGSFYRTPDRCFTLADFPAAPGNDLRFLGTDISELSDVMVDGRVARVATVPEATDPTEVHFFYQPTVFRAEIPLGQGFDAMNPDLQLVPPLCAGAVLRTGDRGPSNNFLPVGERASGIPVGQAIRWDQLGKRLFPVHPGSYRVAWPDQDPVKGSYQIEIVSGYPNDPVKLSSERELPDGRREGNAPNYVTRINLPAAESKFPASPGAHYRHHYDSNPDRSPPTKLDLSAIDHWKFQELTYSDGSAKAAAETAAAGTPFTSLGGRSVLLYSYRPNPDEVADGSLPEENLAVRVVQSTPVNPIRPESFDNPLGRRGLALGGGAPNKVGAVGVISRTGSTVVVNPGSEFVLDFWLNTKNLRPDDDQVTILSTGDGKLEAILDPATSTLTASFFGLSAKHPISTAGSGWTHYVIHVFGEISFGIPVTLLDFYADGLRAEDGIVTAFLDPAASPAFEASPGLKATSLLFGAGATPESGLQLDQIRLRALPGSYLDQGEIRALRERRRTLLRNVNRIMDFSFENAPTDPGTGVYSFPNATGPLQIGVGPRSANDWEVLWARLDVQEVATRLYSALDDAGFNGGGYIMNEVSNYNATLYRRDAEVGSWGPVFPVNHNRLFTDSPGNLPRRRLEVAYYENPHRQDPISHPNVAWPYEEALYNEVIYPTYGPHKDKAIYIASRVGSEGVDRQGKLQQVFGLDQYANLAIYNQPDPDLPGVNPNEEHALAAGANRAALRMKEIGEDIPNNPPLAAFALQNDINVTSPLGYTSDPWVLVQVDNLVTGEPEMAAYQVFKSRPGKIHFPRPSDDDVNDTPGLAYESAPNPEDRFLIMDPEETYNFSYAFSYPVAAGDLLIPPYPLNLVIGNTAMLDARGGNDRNQRTIWRDVYDNPWVVSGDGTFFYQFFYPFRGDFYLPGTPVGTPVAWVPDSLSLFGIPIIRPTFTGEGDRLRPGKVVYHSFWRSGYPKLKRGETLTYQGGEYFNENPGSQGLPALVAMKAAEIVYDVATPTMIINDENLEDFSARIIRPLDRYESPFTVSQMADTGFSPAAPSIFVVAERWYFKDLPGSLQKRFYFDSLAEKLVFRGYLNEKDSGDPDLTSGPDPLNILEPNVITDDDQARLLAIGADDDNVPVDWSTAIEAIFQKSQNPTLIRNEIAPDYPVVTEGYLAGMRESPIVTERIGLNLDLFDATADLVAERARIAKLSRELGIISQPWEVETRPEFELSSGQAALKEELDLAVDEEQKLETEISQLGYDIEELSTQTDPVYAHLDSFGVGSALVPNPKLLTSPVDGSRYVTIVENNRAELDGAPVSLHIIELVPDRYRGALKVIEGSDAFSEKVTIQHSGEFGANTGDLYYEWWIRDAAPLDVVAQEVLADGTLKEFDLSTGQTLWQEYHPKDRAELPNDNPAKRLGLHSIVFEGSPSVVLADKLILMRYKHISEVDTTPDDDNNWTLVPFEFTNPAAEWQPGTNAPFQWTGAANSPQLQADGSKRYIPQLVMGWVKRILDRINPYEARYTDFFGNESPATYSSQIQIAGAPFAGKVALNPDKNVIENTGLIELYETVLQRAKELSIDNSSNPVSTDGINQALLLAATRLAVLYELLAREAYSDAQDSTITVTDDDLDHLEAVTSFTHAFQGLESNLLNEELALLRGTDFRKSYPVFNRMFWNYTKGLGEAAYNVQYNIYDENTDGFINEDDARALYPQGHGDAWGHFVSALGMHYELLQQPVFSWKARSELYALMQNVLEVDYLDEKTFAKLAAGKARAGRDIVRATYRLNYTQDPHGQWQGYTDGADPARAWGVSEWAHRSGQAAYFDWTVANALLPEDAADGTPVVNPENLDRIERSAAEDEIGEVAAGLYEIQNAMDEANNGVNPLGFDSDAIAFDLDPTFLSFGSGIEGDGHFRQIYNRALTAGTNALATLEFAARANNKLRRIADDTDALSVEALRQDIDYRNRLIEIFGRPYAGTIGFGKAYPEGYEGPDTLLFPYLDRTEIAEIIPSGTTSETNDTLIFSEIKATVSGLASDPTLLDIYYDTSGGSSESSAQLSKAVKTFILGNNYENPTASFSMPIQRASDYAFQAPDDWGQRTSYGAVQRALEDMLREEVALQGAIDDYIGFLGDFETLTRLLLNEIELIAEREDLGDQIVATRATINTVITAASILADLSELAEETIDGSIEAAVEGISTVGGFSNDIFFSVRAALLSVSTVTENVFASAKLAAEQAIKAAELLRDEIVEALERDVARTEYVSEIEGMLAEIELLSGAEGPLRATIGGHLQSLEILRQEYFTAQSEGFRLLREREAFNKILAANVQQNRYQDMLFRLSRNEAMTKYQSSFNHAARYTWLAARAYDYETSLDPGAPAAATQLFDQIVKTRQLGLWSDGEPQNGQGGLAEILASLDGNFRVLESQLGLNNLQVANEDISLRRELFRIGPGAAGGGTAASDDRWEDALKARCVEDLWQVPEFRRHCRPFANRSYGEQPGLLIRFRTSIEPGRNFFGWPLAAGDHAYSTANYATRVATAGVFLDDYPAGQLATTPRAYLVPIGNDYLRISTASEPVTRMWSVHDTRIPTPFTINQSHLTAPGFIPSLDGVDGRFGEPRRHGDFRMYHQPGLDLGDDEQSSRLIGRSIWNSEWMLVIPGAGLHADADFGLQRFAESVTDLKLTFKTYSQSGQ